METTRVANHETNKQVAMAKKAPREPANKPKLPNAANPKLLVNLREGDRNQKGSGQAWAKPGSRTHGTLAVFKSKNRASARPSIRTYSANRILDPIAFKSSPFGITNKHRPPLRFAHNSPIFRFSVESALLHRS